MDMEKIKTVQNEMYLSEPWFILRRKIQCTIGSDSCVIVNDIKFLDDYNVEIPIIVTYEAKAQGLVNILKNTFEFGSYSVKIKIFDIDGKEYFAIKHHEIENKDDLKKYLHNGLLTNNLVVGISDGEFKNYSWILEIAKEAIQFYNSNSNDFFKNENLLAIQLFKELIREDYGDNLSIGFTTALNRNAPIEDIVAGVSSSWLTFHSYVYALFKDDYDVNVFPVYGDGANYSFDIVVDKTEKAEAIATILKTEYDFSNVKLKINILGKNYEKAEKIQLISDNPVEDLLRIIKIAFSSNIFIKFVLNLNGTVTNNAKDGYEEILLVTVKDALQIFSHKGNDFYGNENIIVGDLIKSLINVKYNYKTMVDKDIIITLRTTTEFNRNVIN